ncbi:hypothetical protein Rin_00020740 [Candidatus Regiella insecticola 5.15]|uniref:Uncharacterized protein n=1 Tax=Candidatus Regiella insecticola 5.15 TaxID=1005043 RepID=G2H1X7_9ENTR|nr:hypothetical protein [Candidatus Regiella insecticola]EGY28002.1 hypothetical protein Rin_00020740 [Candidatus Regiella insecticola 5.15]
MITVVFSNESYLFIIKSDCELVLFAQGGLYPQSFKLPLGGQGERAMSVDKLRDSGEHPQLTGFKGEGYIAKSF